MMEKITKEQAKELFRLLMNDLEDANRSLYQEKHTIGAISVLQYGLTTNQNLWARELFEWFNEATPPSPPAEKHSCEPSMVQLRRDHMDEEAEAPARRDAGGGTRPAQCNR